MLKGLFKYFITALAILCRVVSITATRWGLDGCL